MTVTWANLILTISAVTAMCPQAQAQLGILDPNSLACTRNSYTQGFGVLPTCSQISSSVPDDIVFYGGANCLSCGVATTIGFKLAQLFGLGGSGACNTPAPWSLKGALFTTPAWKTRVFRRF